MGFCHVAQAGLRLLDSRDLPASTSQSVGITDRNGVILTHCSLCLLGSSESPASASRVAAFSGYSTNTKYDPHQIKAEIASRRDRGNTFVAFGTKHEKRLGNEACSSLDVSFPESGLKRELTQMKQELQYKEKGVETLQEGKGKTQDQDSCSASQLGDVREWVKCINRCRQIPLSSSCLEL
ncbi:Protein WWC3 [Plecturocebus cupreus]